ncbi:hypothetical protein WR25_12816 [Diploscapter pachys]|uniref:Potassium channel domain-containing protein n=1 Tax=Diploscapter pachys TaxID=2018661 RepID=A0A2A2KXF8_9BILA|nr:hypothetical protein WR25_12816 [Diploscapter pachys]
MRAYGLKHPVIRKSTSNVVDTVVSTTKNAKDKDKQNLTMSKAKRVFMKLRSVLRIASAHLALYLFVIFYILTGAYIFHVFEGQHEIETHAIHRRQVQQLRHEIIEKIAATDKANEVDDLLRYFLKNISYMHISLDNYLIYNDPTQRIQMRWTYPASILFSFTILTTIGYGNLSPTIGWCKIATMIYGAIGIPLFLITIADLGRFSKTAIMTVVQAIYKKELKKPGEPQRFLREIAEVLLVIFMFIVFIAIGSVLILMWEDQLTYFDSVYFSYMSLTTIGLGDIVPRRMDFLLPTLIYLTIGLWLTTALVEQLADVFRLVHYAGRQVTDVKRITVWLGGRKLSVGGLIRTVGRRVGISDNLIGQINWDSTIAQALDGHLPPALPIFPWHFQDFLEHDPPLIDLSIDLDQADSSFYCSKPPRPKTRRDSQMSAPILNYKRTKFDEVSLFNSTTYMDA